MSAAQPLVALETKLLREVLDLSYLELNIQVLNELLVSVSNRDLSHSCNLSYLSLGPTLPAEDTCNVDD